jgi:uncharacterized protein YutE (UPF0331/DUF86 family)
MDRQVIEEKIESLRRSLVRVSSKCPRDSADLEADIDAQDIVALNLTRAVQLCVDIAAHIIASREIAPPNTMGQAFDTLAKAGIIEMDLATRLKKSVGFRNIAVHNYNAIDWKIVHAICQHHLGDFREFAQMVSNLEKL